MSYDDFFEPDRSENDEHKDHRHPEEGYYEGKSYDEEEERWYTTGEAARLLGISFITLKRWIYDGKVEAEKTESGDM